MPVCVKNLCPRILARLCFYGAHSCTLVAGCVQQADDRHFELGQVDTNWSNGQLNVTVHQQLVLSSEAREALVHGVPLTLQLELLVRHSREPDPA